MADLPLIMTESGPVPNAPATILQQLLSTVSAQQPGYTANLPGLLIEDISSTDVAAIAQCDQARVDTVNSLTPLGANAFLLLQMGQMTGVTQQGATNTSVQLIFTGTPGYVISPGFLVSDGSYQYYALDGGVVGQAPSGSALGTTPLLTFVATQPGSWAAASGTVTQIATSVPSEYTLSCTNPSNGTPGGTAQSESSFRAQVLQAWSTSAQGTPSFIKTKLGAVSGVDPRLISVQPQSGGGLKVIVGGTFDQIQCAYAIYQGVGDPSILAGSTISTARNNLVSITDYPDVYNIPYVSPPQQVVTAAVTWNTSATGFVNTSAIQQLAAPALAAYVNALACGQPLNVLDFYDAFRNAVVSVLAGPMITRLVIAISVNGIGVAPPSGSEIVAGDIESYFYADPSGSGFTIAQG